jgi:hypothetical protein
MNIHALSLMLVVLMFGILFRRILKNENRLITLLKKENTN